MPRQQFYDPEIQTAPSVGPELPPITNYLGVEQAGVYLLTDDVSVWLARFAERFHGEGRVALLDAARAFAPTEPEPGVEEEAAEQQEASAPGIIPATMQIAVARVEVYPNEEGSYWYARAVDAVGNILGQPVGQVSHHGILGDAERLWPGVTVYEIPDALTDTIWQESNPAATWNGRQRPSPRRLFGQ